MKTRNEALASVRDRPGVSVVIVGAGINGIGLFRDLAMQGVDVLIVDKGDFSSGSSAASSHMVHGGIRYLENGEFRLVREALRERNLLLRNAPHYVRPQPTVIPTFRWMSGILNAPLKFFRLRDKPAERGALVIKIGLTMYDLFTRGQQTLPGHRFALRAKSLELRPKLNPQIVCTATYYDAWMPYPERIALEMILDTEMAYPHATALNYVSAVGAGGDTIMLRDELASETFEVRPQVVVNAAGPWIDFVNRALGRQTQFIGGTKGSHLIADHQELHSATRGQQFFFENEDGRIVLFFPLMDKVIMGTTDIAVDDPDTALCTEQEVDYILEMVRKVFPDIHIDRSHLVFRFCGVRPLPRSDASLTGQISRDHSIRVTEPGGGVDFPIYSLVGGKWTTFRAFAEQTADRVLGWLDRPRVTSTEQAPIGGGRGYPRADSEREAWITALQSEAGLSRERVETLFNRYGTRAAEIARFISAEPDEPLRSQPDYSRREILFLGTSEKVVHLDDLILRRSLLAMLGLVTVELLEELAVILAEPLGWSSRQVRQEIERTIDILRTRHSVNLERAPASV